MTGNTRHQKLQHVLDARALAVVRLPDPDRLLRVVEALIEGGVTGIEVTMTVPGAIEQIRRVYQAFGEQAVLGVGSVLDADTARRAVEAGATYVVSPVFDAGVVEEAHRLGVPAMPGAFTPTEIQTAHKAGADIVKVFPADVVGMAFFRGVLAAMPHLRLMPTGGVSLTNAGEWIRAGACAVGVGSALVDKTAIAAGDWGALRDNARTLMDSIRSAQ